MKIKKDENKDELVLFLSLSNSHVLSVRSNSNCWFMLKGDFNCKEKWFKAPNKTHVIEFIDEEQPEVVGVIKRN